MQTGSREIALTCWLAGFTHEETHRFLTVGMGWKPSVPENHAKAATRDLFAGLDHYASLAFQQTKLRGEAGPEQVKRQPAPAPLRLNKPWRPPA